MSTQPQHPFLGVEGHSPEEGVAREFIDEPFVEFVAKIVSRCNLNCSYCYMYNMGDSTYRGLPAKMPEAVRDALAERIARHLDPRGVRHATIALHGGEPLVFGKRNLTQWVEVVRKRLEQARVKPKFAVQTNAVLIDKEWVTILADLGISVGVSLDGPREFHDRFRVDHAGKGSFDSVMRGIDVFSKHPRGHEVFGGVLTVINPEVDPSALWAFMKSTGIRSFDVRMPLATHDNALLAEPEIFGEWLVKLFDLWFDSGPDRLHIRMFKALIALMFHSSTVLEESMGTNMNHLIIVETDGSIEPSDNLKPCGHGFTKLDLNVLNNDFDEALSYPLMQVSRKAQTDYSIQCQQCELLNVCGGGHLTERYSSLNGFSNPSVYCTAYQRLIKHAQRRVYASLSSAMIRKLTVAAPWER